MIALLPRLPDPVAERLLDGLFTDEGVRWSGYIPDPYPDGVRFAATGGTTISAIRLLELRSSLLELATQYGFLNSGRDQHAFFDAALAGWLSEQEEFRSGDALRDDVWSYFGVVMAPDIVHWRFGRSRERYLGGVRNAFHRVWLRARVLDRGETNEDRWGLLRDLSEDALGAITERPAIGADPYVARELAEGWVRAAGKVGRNRMEPIMRNATIRLRIRNEIQCLGALPASELARTIDEFFELAFNTLRVDQIEIGSSSSREELKASPDKEKIVPTGSRRGLFSIWRA
jgi:hypothetical protein